jgi:hypothetical protein
MEHPNRAELPCNSVYEGSGLRRATHSIFSPSRSLSGPRGRRAGRGRAPRRPRGIRQQGGGARWWRQRRQRRRGRRVRHLGEGGGPWYFDRFRRRAAAAAAARGNGRGRVCVGFYLFWGEMASTKPQTTAWLGVRVLGRMPPSFCLGLQQSQRPTTQKKTGRKKKKPNQLFM